MDARHAAGLGGQAVRSGQNGSRRPDQPHARPQAVGRASHRLAELERPALDDRDVPVLAGTLAGVRSRQRGPAAGGSGMQVLVLASLAYSLVNFRRDLLAAMADAGHEVIACAPDDGEAGITAALDGIGLGFRDIPMSSTGPNPFADLRTLSAYVRLMRPGRPDVVLCYPQQPHISGGIAAPIAGVGGFSAM